MTVAGVVARESGGDDGTCAIVFSSGDGFEPGVTADVIAAAAVEFVVADPFVVDPFAGLLLGFECDCDAESHEISL